MDKKFVLTADQQKLVEEHVNLVDIIIKKYINVNSNVRGLEYDELYSSGCMALCKAASTFDGRVKFATYASTVVRNGLIQHCREVLREYRRSLTITSILEDTFDEEYEIEGSGDKPQFSVDEYKKILTGAKQRYKGAALKGIEAIELRLKGLSSREIAEIYGVKSNNVTSWISKAGVLLKNEI